MTSSRNQISVIIYLFQFLFAMQDGDTQNNTNNEDPNDHEHEDYTNTTMEDSEQPTQVSSGAKRNSNTELDRRKKKSKTRETEVGDQTDAFPNRLRYVDRREEDADDVFGRHIAHELRSITDPRAKQLAKVQIQNVLYEVQFGALPFFVREGDS